LDKATKIDKVKTTLPEGNPGAPASPAVHKPLSQVDEVNEYIEEPWKYQKT
jgi:hypothetical protein